MSSLRLLQPRQSVKNTLLVSAPFLIRLNKVFDTAVVAFFYISRKKAGGQLPLLPMVLETLATHTLSGAGFISTVTPFSVLLYLAFWHGHPPLSFELIICSL